MKISLKEFSLLSGTWLLFFMSSILVITSILFMIMIPITTMNLYISVSISILFAWLISKVILKFNIKFFVLSFLVLLVLFVSFFYVSKYSYDISVDGQGYHQETIIQLSEGWNTIHDNPIKVTGDIWINHYAKGSETLAAVLYKATGSIEAGKIFNFLLIIASFFIVLTSLLSYNNESKIRAIIISLILALNPVSIYQSLSYYIDGQLSSLLLILFALGYLFYKEEKYKTITLIAMTATIILLSNIKFTAVVYACIICLGFLIFYYCFNKRNLLKSFFITLIISFLLGVLLVGFNPYITNTIKHHHPFYPLAGTNAVDIMTEQTPLNLKSINRFEKLYISLFSKSENVLSNHVTTFKLPFTLKQHELETFYIPDTRIGGFGPLFSGAILLGIALYLISLSIVKKNAKILFLIITFILVTCLVNPEAWWARYSPQLWLLPILFSIYGFNIVKSKMIKYISWSIIVIMSINIVLVGVSYFYIQNSINKKLVKEIDLISQQPQPVTVNFFHTKSNRIRFENNGIRYVEQDKLICPNILPVVNSQTQVCIEQK